MSFLNEKVNFSLNLKNPCNFYNHFIKPPQIKSKTLESPHFDQEFIAIEIFFGEFHFGFIIEKRLPAFIATCKLLNILKIK
jgi:hypothetical protein